ncbi:hypothetical protein [Desulfobacula sp.]
MSISGFNKEICFHCKGKDSKCKICNGDEFLFYVHGELVTKEQYREQYNKAITYQNEYSNDYCKICNQFIKGTHYSIHGLCECCYNTEKLNREIQREEQREENEESLKKRLNYQLLRDIAFKRFAIKNNIIGEKMAFIEFGDSTIHVDNIIKVKSYDYQNWMKDKEINYQIIIFTRDGEKHELTLENEIQRNKKYEKIQDILKNDSELYRI